MQQEKYAYDAMCDAACEYRCEVALKSLQEEYGNKLEFTDKEIEARAQELDEDSRCYPDD